MIKRNAPAEFEAFVLEQAGNVSEAQYFGQSADEGNPFGAKNHRLCFEQSFGLSVDLAEATHRFRSSADQGNPFGYFNGVRCLERGFGAAVEMVEAARRYKLSADQ
jgi:TPR repeat protein